MRAYATAANQIRQHNLKPSRARYATTAAGISGMPVNMRADANVVRADGEKKKKNYSIKNIVRGVPETRAFPAVTVRSELRARATSARAGRTAVRSPEKNRTADARGARRNQFAFSRRTTPRTIWSLCRTTAKRFLAVMPTARESFVNAPLRVPSRRGECEIRAKSGPSVRRDNNNNNVRRVKIRKKQNGARERDACLFLSEERKVSPVCWQRGSITLVLRSAERVGDSTPYFNKKITHDREPIPSLR
ncbi:Hypothetical protein CINCED_3A023537 [Cinara cedri]|uniref:Uncharacterized protein n=1 Tax=Cinara cedri TaxID=506608 RepID=A0A5E4M2C6_9HEMI|nr:Hypothetical protein CINCED_3A023537 [Cinara cedri]